MSQGVDVHLSRFSYTESNEKVEPQSLSAKTPTRAVSSEGSPPSMNSSESSYSSRKRGSLEKIPSSVKKMISAFETNVAQVYSILSEVKLINIFPYDDSQ